MVATRGGAVAEVEGGASGQQAGATRTTRSRKRGAPEKPAGGARGGGKGGKAGGKRQKAQADSDSPSKASEPEAQQNASEVTGAETSSAAAKRAAAGKAAASTNDDETVPSPSTANKATDPMVPGPTALATATGKKQASGTQTQATTPQTTPAWGTLISQYPQHPHVPLNEPVFTIGKSRTCNVQLKDPQVSNILCRMWAGSSNFAIIECLGSGSTFTINNEALRKGSRQAVKSGDEITVAGSRMYSFIFQMKKNVGTTPATPVSPSDMAAMLASSCPPLPSQPSVRPPGAALASRVSIEATPDVGEAASVLAEIEAATGFMLGRRPAPRPGSGLLSARAFLNERKGGSSLLNPPGAGRPPRTAWAAAGEAEGAGPSLRKADEGEAGTSAAGAADAVASRRRAVRASAAQSVGADEPPPLVADSTSEGSPEATGATPAAAAGVATAGGDEATGGEGGADKKDGGAGGKEGGADDSAAARAAEAAAEAAAAAARRRQRLKEDFEKDLVEPGSIEESLDDFPYYLGEGTREVLLSIAFLHLKNRDFAHFMRDLPCTSHRICLSGPPGTEIYQQTLVRALARHAGAKLLVLDPARLEAEPPAEEAAAVAAAAGGEGAVKIAAVDGGAAVVAAAGEGADAGKGGEEEEAGKEGGGDEEMVEAEAEAEAEDGAAVVKRKEKENGKGKDGGGGASKGAATATEAKAAAEDGAPGRAEEAEAAAAEKKEGAGAKGMAKGKGRRGRSPPPLPPRMKATAPSPPPPPPPPPPDVAAPVATRPMPFTGGRSAYAGGFAGAALGGASSSRQQKRPPLKQGERVKFVGTGGGLAFSSLPPSFPAALNSYLCGIHEGGSGAGAARAKRGAGSSSGGGGGGGGDDDGPGGSGLRGPLPGYRGKVVVTFTENPRKVGVRFDKAVPGGTNLGNVCEDAHGFFCHASDLRPENALAEDGERSAIDAFFDLAAEEAAKGPLVVLVRDVEKNLLENLDRYIHFKKRLDRLDGRVAVVGSHTVPDRKERPGGGLVLPKLGNNQTALLELSFLDSFSRLEEKAREVPKRVPQASKMLQKLLPNKVSLHPPTDDAVLSKWNKAIERDVATLKAAANRTALSRVLARCGLECADLDDVAVRDEVLGAEAAEKVVGWAAATHLRECAAPVVTAGRLVVSAAAVQTGLDMLKAVQAEAAPTARALRDVTTDNEFEKRLLSEVIPPDEIGVQFNDIGALETVKETLRELVMLPLQRPELFTKGQLTRPCKGILLFGPPGTGKTMLAKAVATEAGANFINISMSSIASKWFGEGEKYVRAVFTLASKIAPSVVFIDEVDSMLGRREKPGEHEAMRKIKNEFMSNWDGLRTRDGERVLVLAATNRPFDLDEAVVRRLPRRLMVDLPDAKNRAKILSVILAKEDLEEGFECDELAALTDGYSGSDLKNLCVAAAYRPIREVLRAEEKARKKAKGEAEEVEAAAATVEAEAKEEAGVASKAKGADEKEKEGAAEAAATTKEGGGAMGGGDGGSSTVEAGTVASRLRTALGKRPAPSDSSGGPPATPHPGLRPLTMEDFRKAIEQVGASVSADAASSNELQQWNAQYGEGGSRKTDTLSYFM